MTSVVIIDDHAVFRDGLRLLLETAGMTVVGEGARVSDVAELMTREPDVVLMDIGLPDGDGVEATRAILSTAPGARVLMLTMYNDDDSLSRALETGARGYLIKSARAAEVIAAIESVASGAIVLGSAVAPRVSRLVGGGAIRLATASNSLFPDLSERERQVLGLMREGLDNSAIAERLDLSRKTVANYVSLVLVKLGARDRAEAAAIAARREG